MVAHQPAPAADPRLAAPLAACASCPTAPCAASEACAAPCRERLATALKGILPVAAVDADAHRDVGAAHGVQGFPTIKFFYSDPKSGSLRSADYSGDRRCAASRPKDQRLQQRLACLH